MTKTLLYTRYAYKTFLWVFAIVTLPFIALRLSSFSLQELPFMFIALLGLIKFYLSGIQTPASLASKVKLQLGANASKQHVVDHVSIYKNAQDAALLINGVLILILNIFL